MKIFLKKLKYWTMASSDAKTPVASNTLKNLFHCFSFAKIAKKMVKRKRNSKLSNPPPPREGDPKTLNIISSEKTVDTMSVAKSPKSASNGKKMGSPRLGIATKPAFL